MLSRRGFAACAVCAAVAGLVAEGADAQSQPAQAMGVTRTVIQSTDFGEKHVTILMAVEIAPGASIARHTHPGIESAFVTEGAAELSVQGHPDRLVKAGEGFQVPAGTPHSARNGDRPTKIAITYVVEKGKPVASPA
jgi:quercetin dioxygenase-like cupin family protein